MVAIATNWVYGLPVNEYLQFRSALQVFVRQFDGYGSIKTPCGENISPTKAHAIMKIGSSNYENLSQKDLASSLGLNKSNITRLVQALEKAGFLKRNTSKTDKRLLLLGLTVKGRSLCKSLEVSSQKYIEELLANIPKKKHQNLIETLELLNSSNLQILNNKEQK